MRKTRCVYKLKKAAVGLNIKMSRSFCLARVLYRTWSGCYSRMARETAQRVLGGIYILTSKHSSTW